MHQAWAGSIGRIVFAVLLLDTARVAGSDTRARATPVRANLRTGSAVLASREPRGGEVLPARLAGLDNVQQSP